MRRRITFTCAGVLSVVLAGCAQVPHARVYRTCLLFDPQPGADSADQFAARETWLAAPSYFDDGQVLYFRERFYDRQGDGFHAHDYFLRQFTVVREGRGHR